MKKAKKLFPYDCDDIVNHGVGCGCLDRSLIDKLEKLQRENVKLKDLVKKLRNK